MFTAIGEREHYLPGKSKSLVVKGRVYLLWYYPDDLTAQEWKCTDIVEPSSFQNMSRNQVNNFEGFLSNSTQE